MSRIDLLDRDLRPDVDAKVGPRFVVAGCGMADWAEHQARGMVEGLRLNGLDAAHVHDTVPARFWDKLHAACAAAVDRGVYVIDGNCRVPLPAGWPKFSTVIDHPGLRIDDLAREPTSTQIGVVDQTHRLALRKLGFSHTAIFFPHAGPEPMERLAPMADRDIPLLFFGGLGADDRTALADRLGDLACCWLADGEAAIEQALADGITAFDALLMQTQRTGRDPLQELDRPKQTVLFGAIEAATSNRRRWQVLGSLGHLPVTIVAPAQPEGLRAALPNATWLRPMPFVEILELMVRSRVVLNIVGKYPAGAHDRVFDAMALGAAVATDPSRFLAVDFVDGQSILYLQSGGVVCRRMRLPRWRKWLPTPPRPRGSSRRPTRSIAAVTLGGIVSDRFRPSRKRYRSFASVDPDENAICDPRWRSLTVRRPNNIQPSG